MTTTDEKEIKIKALNILVLHSSLDLTGVVAEVEHIPRLARLVIGVVGTRVLGFPAVHQVHALVSFCTNDVRRGTFRTCLLG